MKVIYIVFSIAAFAVSANAGVASVETREQHPINWYDCSGRRDGNYLHPYDCTRFISCSGGIASERDCPICTVDAVSCPQGRLVYDARNDSCLWAHQTTCSTSPQPSTDSPTQQPTVVPPIPSSERPSFTTEGSGLTQQPPSGTTHNPSVGDECGPEDCVNTGYCQSFKTCINGTWHELECEKDLVWNPLNPDGTKHPHGGNCDLRSNLLDKIKDEYANDKRCFGCFWEEIGKCNANYMYQAPNEKNRNVQTLSCAASLVFDEEMRTCVKCSSAKNNDGSPCDC